MNIATTNGPHCTRIVTGGTIECYRKAVAEYRTKSGHMIVRLCKVHDTRVAHNAAVTLHLIRTEL